MSERWSLEKCEKYKPEKPWSFMDSYAHTPVDRPRLNLREAVPYNQKTLDRMTEKLLSRSPEFKSPNTRNPLHAPTSRTWFGMSAKDQRYLLSWEKRTGYFVNREELC